MSVSDWDTIFKRKQYNVKQEIVELSGKKIASLVGR